MPLQLNIDIDASNQIVQNCRAVRGEGQAENKFMIAGCGGIPPSPNKPLRNEEAIAPVRSKRFSAETLTASLSNR